MRSIQSSANPWSRLAGFTLMELMIAVAIMGITAAIALPSYTSYVANAKRADARTQLVQAAQFMQRFYAANDGFLTDRANNGVLSQVPANLLRSPADGAKLYDLSIPLGADPLTNAMSFTIRMVPVAGAGMAGDRCGTFTLTSTGLRGVLVGGSVGSADLRDSCWK